jgi:hypothetical protein
VGVTQRKVKIKNKSRPNGFVLRASAKHEPFPRACAAWMCLYCRYSDTKRTSMLYLV